VPHPLDGPRGHSVFPPELVVPYSAPSGPTVTFAHGFCPSGPERSKKRRFRTAPDNCRSTTRMAFYGPTVEGYLPPAISISSVWAWNQSWSACLLVLSLDSWIW
jgi:hypothetical protein